jgi:phosphate transport system substrate-binding protein
MLLFLTAAPAFAGVSLKGTGSSLAAELFSDWSRAFHGSGQEVRLRYDPKDSAEGVARALGRNVDFGVTDTPLTEAERRKTKGWPLLQLPIGIEGVAIAYNLPGVPPGLKLTAAVLSDIFSGRIRNWNDIALRNLNPGVSLPAMEIRVVHQGEAGTRQDLFPSLLAKWDPAWAPKGKKDRFLRWPVGKKVDGDEKIYKMLRLWPGIITAVDLPFAVKAHLPLAAVQNRAGRFILPSVEGLEAATADTPNLPEDLSLNLDESRSLQAYPLASLCYLLVTQDYGRAHHDQRKSAGLEDFLDWALSTGQEREADLSYGPLPASFLVQVRAKAKTILYP